MTAKIRILVADDHPLYRNGVVMTLQDDPAFEIVAVCADAASAIAQAAIHKPDVALLDISMPGNGINAARQISAANPGVRIAMLTVSEDDDDVMQALQSGALGYILKGVGGVELIDLIKELAEGKSYVSPTLAARLLKALQTPAKSKKPVDDLSKREEDILRLVAQGFSNKEVGNALDIQEKTVKHYMTAILQKLHVRNRVEAAMLARETWGTKVPK